MLSGKVSFKASGSPDCSAQHDATWFHCNSCQCYQQYPIPGQSTAISSAMLQKEQKCPVTEMSVVDWTPSSSTPPLAVKSVANMNSKAIITHYSEGSAPVLVGLGVELYGSPCVNPTEHA